MNYRIKMRGIGMAILNIIMDKKISLLYERDQLNESISFELAQQLVANLKERFMKILTDP